MGATQPPPEMEADFAEVGEQRRADRRGRERRLQRQRFSTPFAATLINQIAAPEAPRLRRYPTLTLRRVGQALNLRA